MNKILLLILIITFTNKAVSLDINLDSILINSRIENTIEIIKNDSLFKYLMKIKNENISFRICDSVLIKDISQIQIKRFYCNINVRVYQQLLNQSIINFNKYYNCEQPKITINKNFINKYSDFLVSIGICTNNIFEFYVFTLTVIANTSSDS
jgi:hypothetical protein